MTRALVLRAAGTNCDAEMARAFELAGARSSVVHIDRIIAEPRRLEDADLIGFPGGFSYGDDIASGRIFAVRLRERAYPALRDAARRGCHMIGVCNGFQIMVQIGLLPGPAPGEDWPTERAPAQSVTLTVNQGGRFIDRWVTVECDERSPCIWTRGLAEAFSGERGVEVLRLPIAHGEGRFVASSPAVLSTIEGNSLVAVRYGREENPNGSQGTGGGVAGICDASGRIFGLMPHPERFLDWTLHPFWTRLRTEHMRGPTPGLMMFQNAVRAVRGVGASI